LSKWPELSVLQQAAGQPFGGGYGHSERAPHNGYVQLLYRVGAIGLLAYLISLVGTSVRLFLSGMKQPNQSNYGLSLALLTGLVFYYIPYSMQPEHAVIFGMAISLSRLGIRKSQLSAIKGQCQTVVFNQANSPHNLHQGYLS
jgi:O-antigen ligase